MFPAATADIWTVLGVTMVLVGPLYLALAKLYSDIRGADVDQNQDDIASNEDDIQDIRQSLARLEAEIEEVQAGLRIIHDNMIDHNPCRSEECIWCEAPEDKD